MKPLIFIKKYRKIILPVTLVILGFGSHLFKAATPESYLVKKSNISQEVSFTGKVKPAENVDLSFEKSARIVSVSVVVGSEVFAGEVLATLDSGELLSDLRKAEANLKAEQARLDEVISGTRKEELTLETSKVAGALSSKDGALKTLKDNIKNAYVKAEDAILAKSDQAFVNPQTSNPNLAAFSIDSSLKSEVERDRVSMSRVLKDWNSSLSLIDSKDTTINPGIATSAEQAKKYLSIVFDYLNKLSLIINNPNNQSLDQTYGGDFAAWRTEISAAKVNVSNAISDIISSEDHYVGTISDYQISQNQLLLKQAPPEVNALAIQQAAVDGAEASVANVRAELRHNSIISPINGVVSKEAIKVGELATPSQPVISIISDSNYQIEANVAEVDVVKIKKGDLATVTLDAYGDEVPFEARLVELDLGESIIDGVPTYKTVFQFTSNDKRPRSGMTANLVIISRKKDNVLVVPQRLIKKDDGGVESVKVALKGGKFEFKTVTTGLRGSDGLVEILTGVGEGDQIVTYHEN